MNCTPLNLILRLLFYNSKFYFDGLNLCFIFELTNHSLKLTGEEMSEKQMSDKHKVINTVWGVGDAHLRFHGESIKNDSWHIISTDRPGTFC